MRDAGLRLGLLSVTLLAAAAPTAAARAPVALIASPAHVSLAGSGTTTVSVTNTGTRTAIVDVARGRLALDLHGRPRVLPRRTSWLRVKPSELALGPGGTAEIRMTVSVPPGAEPGDHSEAVLLTTRSTPGAVLAVRMRLGVVVVVRAPGKIVHRLELLGLRRLGRRLELSVANRGNVTETVGACATVTISRGAVTLARLHPLSRRLLPHSNGIVEARSPPLHGAVVARVDLCAGRPRTFALRL